MATVEVCLQRTLQQIHWDPVIGSRVELSLPGRNNGNPKHETSVSGSCFRHFRTKISYLVITTEFHYFQPMFIAGLKHKFKVSHRGDRHHVYIPSISCITLFCLDLLKAPQNNSTYSILSSIYSGFPHIFLCFSRTKLKTSTKRPRGHGPSFRAPQLRWPCAHARWSPYKTPHQVPRSAKAAKGWKTERWSSVM